MESLPRSNVLNYLAATDTPTRVRLVASRIVRIIGICYLLVGLISALTESLALWQVAKNLRSAGNPFSLPLTIEFTTFKPGWMILPLLAFGGWSFGVLLWLAFRPIRNGHGLWCRIARGALGPGLLLCLAITTFIATEAVWNFVRPEGLSPMLLLLQIAVFSLCLVLTLGLVDVMRLLKWILKNPGTERPAVPFLPVVPVPPSKENAVPPNCLNACRW